MKRRKLQIWAMLILFGLVIGCRRDDESTKPATPQTAPTTLPAKPFSALPTQSELIIDGRSAVFPGAELHIVGTNPLTMTLFSKDGPKGGNTFYFQITLENVADESALDGTVWEYSMMPDRVEGDDATLITLFGNSSQLQPREIRVVFSGDGKRFSAQLSGQWGLFTQPDATVPDRVLLVTGTLTADAQQD